MIEIKVRMFVLACTILQESLLWFERIFCCFFNRKKGFGLTCANHVILTRPDCSEGVKPSSSGFRSFKIPGKNVFKRFSVRFLPFKAELIAKGTRKLNLIIFPTPLVFKKCFFFHPFNKVSSKSIFLLSLLKNSCCSSFYSFSPFSTLLLCFQHKIKSKSKN